MKRIFSILFICLVASVMFAEEGKPKFLFKTFQKSLVYYKDGRVFETTLNYDFRRNKFVFLDQTDHNREKIFAEPEMVKIVKIGKRIFQLGRAGVAQELLCTEPILFATYIGNQLNGKRVGYGGRTQTAAVRTYSAMHANGMNYKFEEDDIVISSIDIKYILVRKKKEKEFSNKKQFLKLYPKEKRSLITRYISEKKTNFKKPSAVLLLVKYAENL